MTREEACEKCLKLNGKYEKNNLCVIRRGKEYFVVEKNIFKEKSMNAEKKTRKISKRFLEFRKKRDEILPKALEMREKENKKWYEIAEHFNVPLSTLKTWIEAHKRLWDL